MTAFFESLENRVYGFLSLLIALNTLFFIASQSASLTLFRLTKNNDYFYLGFVVLAVLVLGSIAYFWQEFNWEKHLSTILLICLPGSIILTYGLNESHNFHYIFQLALGTYVILSGILISAFHIGKAREMREGDPKALTFKQWFIVQGIPTLLLVIFSTALFFSFGMYRLTEYAAVDEPLWLDGRIARYWKNIGEHDWKGTEISDKPGITVAFASGFGTLLKSTREYRTIHFQGEIFNLKNDVESYYFAFRFPQLLFVSLVLLLFYFFLERLVGRKSALFSYVLIATSPVLIGMSKIINPDSLLWIFVPLSLISYLVFRKRESFRYLIFSGIFLGLALLTKYVANILFVFFLGLIFLEYLYNPRYAVVSFLEYLKQSLKNFAVLVFSALSVFYILFPAVWIQPSKLLTGTLMSQAFEKITPLFLILVVFVILDQWINQARITTTILVLLKKIKRNIAIFIALVFFFAVLFTVFNTWLGMTPYNFMELLSSPKTIAGRSDFVGIFLTNFYPLIFGVTPIVFLLLFLAPFSFFKKTFMESEALRTSFYLVIFILLYYLGTTVNNVAAIVRYQIILFPLTAIIAGITLKHILEFIYKKFSIASQFALTPIFVASFIVFFGALTMFSTPFPLSYASAFLPTQYHIDVKDMGAGSYEMAQYLNALPDAKEMLIWTDKDGVCKFFVGRCKRGRDYQKLRVDGLDYIIVSAGRENRTTGMMRGDIANQKRDLIRFDQYYEKTNPSFQILINNRPSHFVKVFSFEK
jgi:4-amino-4-deoxy-L-arabinose transferase-like glycosyltransferase